MGSYLFPARTARDANPIRAEPSQQPACAAPVRHLFVVRAANATLTEDDVVAHCRKELTGYKVPKIVRFVDALPKSTVGKILRRELRDVA